MNDKRRFPRVEIHEAVRVAIIYSANSKNISEGGICITTDQPLDKGTELTLIFSLPGTGEEGRIKTFGKVAWMKSLQESRDGKPLYEIGFEFWDIDPRYVEIIREYIDRTGHERE